jgi:uncharacterized repeat protein (TIGR02543 family)
MKKTFLLKTMFLLCALVTWGNAWADDASFTTSNFSGQGTSGSGSAISATVDGVTFTCDKGFGTSQIRCYKDSKITISSSNTITAISFSFSGSYTGGLATSYTGLSTNSWEQTLGSQARITAITVTYTAASYTITAVSNDETMGTVSGTTTITATPKSGYRVKAGDEGYTVTSGTATVTNNGDNTFSVTASSDCTIRINFEAIPTHTLSSVAAPVAGGTVDLDATTILEGATATATASPNDGYKFTGWSISGTGASLSSTSSNPTTVTMGTADATVTANFEAVVTHEIKWSVNGVIVKTENVEENTALDFAAPASVPAGYVFRGWSEVEIITPQDDAPAMVSSATSTADVTYYAVIAEVVGSTPESWTETPLASMTASDVFVFSNGNSAMTNDNGTTDAPATSAITVSAGQITSAVADNIKWNVSGNSTVGYTFYPNGSTTTWLYCSTTASSGSNNNIRVGTGNRKAWVINTGGYLVTNDESTERYLSIYNDQDFRGYINTNLAFVPKFYKHIAASNSYGNYCTKLADVITVSAAGWATYCSEYALDFTGVTELTAYTATKVGDAVKFNKVTGKVPANTGLLVSGTTANVPVAASADAVTNILKGVTAETVKIAGTVFVLKQGANGLGFYKNTNDFTVRANSAYLPATAVAGARAFIALDDEATGIENLTPVLSKGEGVVYDLSGRRVVTPTKGLYIVNGKKVFVK